MIRQVGLAKLILWIVFVTYVKHGSLHGELALVMLNSSVK